MIIEDFEVNILAITKSLISQFSPKKKLTETI